MALQWKPPTKPSVAGEAPEARVRPQATWVRATAPPPPPVTAHQWRAPTTTSVSVEAIEARFRPQAPWALATIVSPPPTLTRPVTAVQWKAPTSPPVAVEAPEARVRPQATWVRTTNNTPQPLRVQPHAPLATPLVKTSLAGNIANDFLDKISGGLNSERTPAEGQSRFKVHEVDKDDIDAVRHLVDSATPSAEATLSNHRKFLKWREENPTVVSNGFAIAMFATQAAKTLSPGTASNMATAELKHLRSCGETIKDMAFLGHVIEGLDLQYAQLGAKHAVDITDEEAAGFLLQIKRIDVRALVWLMLTCGARDADLLRLVDLQMTIHEASLELEFRVTKTARSVADKRHVSFPFVHQLDKDVRAFLSKPHTLPGCDTVNKVLKAAKLKEENVGGKRRSITTYSFRRLFDQRVISWYTDPDGCTEWLKVITWSGHADSKIISSTYAQCKVLKVPKKRPAETEAPAPTCASSPSEPVTALQLQEKKTSSPQQDAVKRMFRRMQK